MAEQELTAEAKKQRRKREKANEKKAALGVEKFTVEVAGVFKGDIRKMMKAHGINNQQDIHQRLLINLIAADFETQAQMLKCVTTPFVVTEKVLQIIRAAGLKSLATTRPSLKMRLHIPLNFDSESQRAGCIHTVGRAVWRRSQDVTFKVRTYSQGNLDVSKSGRIAIVPILTLFQRNKILVSNVSIYQLKRLRIHS